MTREHSYENIFPAGGTDLLFLSGGPLPLKICTPRNGDGDVEQARSWSPAYASPAAVDELDRRVEKAYAMLEKCELCPRLCSVNRRQGELGFCRGPGKAVVSSAQPHYGEELPLVGRGGSGTIFFSNCSLRCVFCQNWPIAHEGRGREVSDEELASMMIDLQGKGCHNINVVTPTHFLPNILGALRIAIDGGLHLPVCYNTSGYERAEIIRLLDGIVDIYLPDMKFMNSESAQRYNLAAAFDYPQRAREAISEMHRQVGELVTDDRGVALSGLMIRHLVMPNRAAGTREFVQWVAEKLSRETYVNIMAQYRAEYRAFKYEEIARAITTEEFVEAMGEAVEAGLSNLDERSLAQLEVHRRQAY